MRATKIVLRHRAGTELTDDSSRRRRHDSAGGGRGEEGDNQSENEGSRRFECEDDGGFRGGGAMKDGSVG